MCICASYVHIDIYMYIWICKLKEHKKKVYHTQTTLFLILLRLCHFFFQCMHTTWPADCGERFVFVVVVLNAIARCCCCRFAAAFVMTSRICLHLHLHLQCGARFLQFPSWFCYILHKWFINGVPLLLVATSIELNWLEMSIASASLATENCLKLCVN